MKNINHTRSSISDFFIIILSTTTNIYTLSLHDALPISQLQSPLDRIFLLLEGSPDHQAGITATAKADFRRSEEHTSELQSQSKLVCRLLLEKKKNTMKNINHTRSSISDDIRHILCSSANMRRAIPLILQIGRASCRERV